MWGLTVRKRTARPAESSSREDPASRRLRVKLGALRNRRPQAACSLPLAPVSSRRSLSVEAPPRVQLACQTFAPENTPLLQHLRRPISRYDTRTIGGWPTSACTRKCYAHWDWGLSRESPSHFGLFSGLAGRVVSAVTSVCPSWFLSGCACGTLRASARVFADWVELCPEGSPNPIR